MNEQELVKLKEDLELYQLEHKHSSHTEDLAFETIIMSIRRKLILIRWN